MAFESTMHSLDFIISSSPHPCTSSLGMHKVIASLEISIFIKYTLFYTCRHVNVLLLHSCFNISFQFCLYLIGKVLLGSAFVIYDPGIQVLHKLLFKNIPEIPVDKPHLYVDTFM